MVAGTAKQERANEAFAALSNIVATPLNTFIARQKSLRRLWVYFDCEQYSDRLYSWDGVAQEMTDAVMQYTDIPDGFANVGGADAPLAQRKPRSQYNLVRIAIKKITTMLFTDRRIPTVQFIGDENTNKFLEGIIESTQFWTVMECARDIGGALGSFCVGVKIINSRVVFEVFNAQECVPVFTDETQTELEQLEIRRIYNDDVVMADGSIDSVQFWYRRVITKQHDIVWKRVPHTGNTEPNWELFKHTVVEHGLEEVPAVWGHNIKRLDSVDGEPDCKGAYELADEIDQLASQSCQGTLNNCDPTLLIKTVDTGATDTIQKGSGNAIQVEVNGDAKYLEMQGNGITTATEIIDRYILQFQRITRVIIEGARKRKDSGGNKTLGEVTLDYNDFFSNCDSRRNQYGNFLIKPVLMKTLKLCALINDTVFVDDTGEQAEGNIILPPYFDELTGTHKHRQIGSIDGVLTITWPPYTNPSLQDTQLAVNAAAAAVQENLVTHEDAIAFVAQYIPAKSFAKSVEILKNKMQEMQAGALNETAGFLPGKK